MRSICLVLLGLFGVISCSNSASKPMQIRLVDLNGNYRTVKTRIPQSNVSVLASQGKLTKEEVAYKDGEKVDRKDDVAADVKGMKQIAGNKYANKPVTITSPQQSGAVPVVAYSDNEKTTIAADTQLAAKDKNDSEKLDLAAAADDNFKGDVSSAPTLEQAQKKNDASPINPNQPIVTSDPQNKVITIVQQKRKPTAKEVAPVKEIVIDQQDVKSDVKIKGIYLQAGSFFSKETAEKTLEKMKKFHNNGVVEEAVNDESKDIYRVLIGPFNSKAKARAVSSNIKASGRDAVIVKR